jgi:hypothetical protein
MLLLSRLTYNTLNVLALGGVESAPSLLIISSVRKGTRGTHNSLGLVVKDVLDLLKDLRGELGQDVESLEVVDDLFRLYHELRNVIVRQMAIPW